MQGISIKVKNYKCFKEEAGFDSIQRVNLIIGKNNSGKSSLLDVIESVANTNYQFPQPTWNGKQQPEIIFSSKVPSEIIETVFRSNMSGDPIGNHFHYGKRLVGRDIVWRKVGRNKGTAQLIYCSDEDIRVPLAKANNLGNTLVGQMPIPLEGKKFRRVSAERDIIPEEDHDQSDKINVLPNGIGITRAIQKFLNSSTLPREVVEQDILDALNEIFAHDAKFTRIICQVHNGLKWEIFLEEEEKGPIALSKSGSGLKTVITVLANLLLVPQIDNDKLSNYIFGFEELENNIHPALLRRLNNYIYRCSIENDFIYFLTTHSNVLIDQFSKQKDAQILHVTQSDGYAKCTTAKTYIDSNGILDDLDVRASDILQANGIIWVEGPSDRVYLNRWIELWSKGELAEGTHYQIVFYGGRLLSHLSADIQDFNEDGISILKANRNAAILIDSDKHNRQTKINDTKKRIEKEFDEIGAPCWITNGKEIENYIPVDVVKSHWAINKAEQVGKYDCFFSYLDGLTANEGSKYSKKKSLLAEKLVPHMTLDNMKAVLDLDEKMTVMCEEIRNWNS